MITKEAAATLIDDIDEACRIYSLTELGNRLKESGFDEDIVYLIKKSMSLAVRARRLQSMGTLERLDVGRAVLGELKEEWLSIDKMASSLSSLLAQVEGG